MLLFVKVDPHFSQQAVIYSDPQAKLKRMLLGGCLHSFFFIPSSNIRNSRFECRGRDH
jgi:hypothetical protein